MYRTPVSTPAYSDRPKDAAHSDRPKDATHSVHFAQSAPNHTSEGISEGPFGLSSNNSSRSSNDGDMGRDPFELEDDEYRERTEWHQMLTSALCSQVVDGEKKRLNAQADSYLFNLTENEHAEQLNEHLRNGHEDRLHFKHAHLELWLGCRAAIRGRTPLQERQTLESLRSHHVDTTLRAVIDFSAEAAAATTVASDESALPAEFSAQCLAQLQKLLRRVDYVEGMYPTLRALGDAKPIYASDMFQVKLAAITSWTNVSVRIELLYRMVQRWTGSQELNLYATDSPSAYVSTTSGVTDAGIAASPEHSGPVAPLSPLSSSTRAALDAVKKRAQHTPFIERLLKENGMKMIFERKILTQLETVTVSARKDLIKIADMVSEMGLPVTSRNLQELLLFPPRLLQTCLQIRLQSAENMVNPPLAQVDQLIEDIRDSLSVACRVKRTFVSLAAREGRWDPGIRLDPQYDTTLRRCLHMYFRLVHRKLVISKSAGSGAGTRDFEILENQWPFLLEIVRDIDGGHYELVLRYCQQ
ncbi:Suppressor of Sensor Kinase (SLN1), partial [Coemansia sp. RSA 2618]